VIWRSGDLSGDLAIYLAIWRSGDCRHRLAAAS